MSGPEPVLMRVHSECLTGDVLASSRCDCGPQLPLAHGRIAAEGRGAIIYLRGHEGRGIGFGPKLQAYALQDQSLDTLDAKLYDGATIGPYRFVQPPKVLARFNQKPYSFNPRPRRRGTRRRREARYPIGPDRFRAVTAATIDNQASINLPDGSIEPAPGETEIELTIEPLDPATVGPPPPKVGYDGNAYRFSARYARSGQPVKVRPGCPPDAAPGSSPLCLTPIVHYSFGPVLGRGDTRIYRHTDDGWVALPSKDVLNLLHVYASSEELGTFVPAGVNRPRGTNPRPTEKPAALLAGGGLLAGLLLLGITRPWSRRRRRRPATKGDPVR